MRIRRILRAILLWLVTFFWGEAEGRHREGVPVESEEPATEETTESERRTATLPLPVIQADLPPNVIPWGRRLAPWQGVPSYRPPYENPPRGLRIPRKQIHIPDHGDILV